MPTKARSPLTGRRLFLGAVTLLVLVMGGLVIGLQKPGTSAGPAAKMLPAQLAVGNEVFQKVPELTLIGEDGKPTSLAAFRGKWLIFAPSMTLCHEECPMTTGALMAISRDIKREHLGSEVAVAEVTVDPWRDSPARLRAYRKMVGANFHLLTGTLPEIRRFWKFFGIYFKKTKPDKPVPTDWWTGKKETMDVEHGDALFMLDPKGNERVVAEGQADLHGRLSAPLRKLLDEEGRENLAHPSEPWSVSGVLEDFDWFTNREVPASEVQQQSAPNPGAVSRELANSPRTLSSLHEQGGRLIGDSAGLEARVKALKGYPIVINAWASWCPPCQQEFPLFASASALYGRKVAFLGADTEDQAGNARSFLAKHPVSYPSYRNSSYDIAGLANTANLPTTVFIDAEGKVTYVYKGAFANLGALEADIQRYALGEPD